MKLRKANGPNVSPQVKKRKLQDEEKASSDTDCQAKKCSGGKKDKNQNKFSVKEEGEKTNGPSQSPPAKKRKFQNESVSSSDSDDKESKQKGGKKEKRFPKQIAAMERPKVYVTKEQVRLEPKSTDKKCAPNVEQSSITVTDLRHLLLYFFRRDASLQGPNWCCVLRRTWATSMVLVVLNDVGAADFLQNKDCFPFLCETFDEDSRSNPSVIVRMANPSSYFSTFDFDMYAVPIYSDHVRHLWKVKPVQYGSNKKYTEKGQDKKSPCKKNDEDEKSSCNENKEVEKTTSKDNKEVEKSLCTKNEEVKKSTCSENKEDEKSMFEENKVDKKPPAINNKEVEKSTCKENKEDEKSPLSADSARETTQPPTADEPAVNGDDGNESLAQGCRKKQLLMSVERMAEDGYRLPPAWDSQGFVWSRDRYEQATDNSPLFSVDCEMCLTPESHEVTRVSVISENGDVIYDELVKPFNPIINYLTRYSGITKAMLEPVTKRLADVQAEVSRLLPPDAILCGQSLGNDLKALKMYHPYVIDTSVIYNLSGNRRMKCGLRRLAFTFLDRVIQESKEGHCSAEDARAALDLVKLKLQNGLAFGDAVAWVRAETARQHAKTPASTSTKKEKTQQTPPQRKEKPKQTPPKRKGKMPMVKIQTDLPPVDAKWQEQHPHKDVSALGSFFGVLDILKVSACLIGEDKFVSKFKEEPQLDCVTVTSDKEAQKEAATSHGTHKFTWVEFNAFRDLLSKADDETDENGEQRPPPLQEQKKTLTKLDKSLKKLMKNLGDKTVLAVVMTGRNEGNMHMDGASFIHLTRCS